MSYSAQNRTASALLILLVLIIITKTFVKAFFLFLEDSLYLTKRFADYSQHLSTSKECCAGMLALQFSDILCIPQRNSPVNIRGNPMSLRRSVYWSNIIVQEDDLTSNSHNSSTQQFHSSIPSSSIFWGGRTLINELSQIRNRMTVNLLLF